MTIDNFLRTVDAIRFDTDIDAQDPELRSIARTCYPILRKLYNKMGEAGMLTESHGVKRHNTPKDELAAYRKGERDGAMEKNGPGFKSFTKTHKTSKKDKRMGKINKNNYDRFVEEAVLKSIKKVMKEDRVTVSGDFDFAPDDGKYGENYPGIRIDWGQNIEKLIKQLSDIFLECNVPEEDEYGIKQSAFDSLISHLKYYYDVEKFNYRAFNDIYDLLDNYDLVLDDRVTKILNRLKLYI